MTLVVALATMLIVAAQTASAAVVPYATGDVFAGIGSGMINHFSPTGTLKNTLDTTSGSAEDTGMCFDTSGNLYSTNFQANNMSKFDSSGTLLTHPFGTGFNSHPESCVFDAAGNVYVGQADGSADILKFDQAGTPLASFDPATEVRGTDWIDLAPDQCTIYYTSEGTSVKRFDVCANTQLADFATGLPGSNAFALRLLPLGSALVADRELVVRLDATGTVVQTYPASNYGSSFLFALNLDPDGTTFWTADIFSGLITRIDIATGAQVTQFSSQPLGTTAGLAIFGEPTQGGGNACGSSPNPPCLIEVRPRSMFLTEADNCVGLTINILQGKVSDGTVGVTWKTVAGTAKPPQDYDNAGAAVTFPAGTNTTNITVCINDDAVTEPRESFSVQLLQPVNATIEPAGQKSTIFINSNTN